MPFYRCNSTGAKKRLYLIQSGVLVSGTTEKIYNSLGTYPWSITANSGYRYLNGHGYANNYYMLSNPLIHNYDELHLKCSGYFIFNLNGAGNITVFSSLLQQSTNKLDLGRSCTFPAAANSEELELVLKLDGVTDNVVIMGGCYARTSYINNQHAFLKLYDMWIQ